MRTLRGMVPVTYGVSPAARTAVVMPSTSAMNPLNDPMLRVWKYEISIRPLEETTRSCA